jgi:hypothetical protein
MVAHQQHGPLRRDSIQARDIRAEVDLRQRPQRRKRLTDLIGKTQAELRSLHFRRDRDWLQS